jgi:hypothetical protein
MDSTECPNEWCHRTYLIRSAVFFSSPRHVSRDNFSSPHHSKSRSENCVLRWLSDLKFWSSSQYFTHLFVLRHWVSKRQTTSVPTDLDTFPSTTLFPPHSKLLRHIMTPSNSPFLNDRKPISTVPMDKLRYLCPMPIKRRQAIDNIGSSQVVLRANRAIMTRNGSSSSRSPDLSTSKLRHLRD